MSNARVRDQTLAGTQGSVGRATHDGDTDAVSVLWLTTNYPSHGDPVSGIFHRTAARALARSGVAVAVASPTPAAPWPLSRIRDRWRGYAEAPPRERDEGVDVVRPRYFAIPGDPSWSRSDEVMERAVRPLLRPRPRFDLLHAHFAAPMGMVAWRLARTSRLPYLITLHGSEEVWRGSHASRIPAYRAALRGASRVLAVSQSLVEEARDVARVQAVELPIGIDLARFATRHIERDAARDALGLPRDRILILLVATLIPAKGIRPFVDSVILLGHPFLAVLVGEGPEAGFRAADPAARGLVEYHGAVANQQIPTYMAAADALVLPSDTEGLPTVLVEAGAAGLPVIASRVGGVPHLLAGDRGVLLPEVSVSAIADAVASVTRDREGARARADRLRRHVLEHYDAAANARRLAEIYRSVLSAPRVRG